MWKWKIQTKFIHSFQTETLHIHGKVLKQDKTTGQRGRAKGVSFILDVLISVKKPKIFLSLFFFFLIYHTLIIWGVFSVVISNMHTVYLGQVHLHDCPSASLPPPPLSSSIWWVPSHCHQAACFHPLRPSLSFPSPPLLHHHFRSTQMSKNMQCSVFWTCLISLNMTSIFQCLITMHLLPLCIFHITITRHY
jgi:hypothetical protein